MAFLKSATLAGEPEDAAAYVRAQLGDGCDSPTSCYALAVAALVEGDDAAAADAAARMAEGGEPFARAGDALGAIAAGDRDRYASAVAAIVADFERRVVAPHRRRGGRHRDADGGPRRAARDGGAAPLGADPRGRLSPRRPRAAE